MKKTQKKRELGPRATKTWTFQPSNDVARNVEAEIKRRGGGRGVKSAVLNEMLRGEMAAQIARRYERASQAKANDAKPPGSNTAPPRA